MIIHKAHGFTMAERFQRAKNGCVAKALGDATRVEQMNLRGLHAGFSGKHRGHCAMTEPLAALSADKNFPTVLVMYASQSGRTARLAQAATDGARQAEPGARVWLRPALEARVEDLLAADALLLATPENFGYMAGALKDFFDRTYYPAQGRCQGLAAGEFADRGRRVHPHSAQSPVPSCEGAPGYCQRADRAVDGARPTVHAQRSPARVRGGAR